MNDSSEYNDMVALVRKIRHDASNPLTAALGSVQLLLTDPAVENPDVRQQLEEVERELRRMTEILARLKEIRPRGDDRPPPTAA
ncbi:MAG: histidine kinase dimerization/phospho-acceptor domain-containing protein [Longimicrobiales bacterium]